MIPVKRVARFCFVAANLDKFSPSESNVHRNLTIAKEASLKMKLNAK